MHSASKNLGTCRYSVKAYCGLAKAIYVNLPYGLEEQDIRVTSEVELMDEIVYALAVGVARGKGPRRKESLTASSEVFRDH